MIRLSNSSCIAYKVYFFVWQTSILSALKDQERSNKTSRLTSVRCVVTLLFHKKLSIPNTQPTHELQKKIKSWSLESCLEMLHWKRIQFLNLASSMLHEISNHTWCNWKAFASCVFCNVSSRLQCKNEFLKRIQVLNLASQMLHEMSNHMLWN